MPPLADPNIASPVHKADPFPFYARLREEAPVFRVTLPDKQSAWLISRYDDVAAALVDPRLAKDKRNALSREQAAKQPWVPPLFRPLMENMLDLDPPRHARLRALVQKAFTPRLVERMRPRIERLADELLSTALRKGTFDLISDYALPIPTTVIAEMLGVPVEDSQRFNRWSKAIVSSNASGIGSILIIPHVWSFLRYIRRLIVSKRRQPEDDLLTSLVQADEEGDVFTDDELVAMVFLLLVAGHETTVNLIGNGMLALMTHRLELTRLKDNPDGLRTAVEELLRFAGPLETATERYAREELAIAGLEIPAGSLVFAAIASANRDERQFSKANELDIAREPNKHLSFGLGPHYCLGAPLARMEGQIAIATLLRRAPELHLAVDSNRLRWRKGLVLRGLEALPTKR